MVVLVRSGSDYNQVPLSFFTDEPMATFLPKVYGIDVQDMLTRMEGYSVAGGTLAGMAATYKERVHAAKNELSAKLRMGLRECCDKLSSAPHHSPVLKLGLISGQPKAKMQYKTFFRDITIKLQVVLRNWPHKQFKAPGSMGHSLPAITKLLDLVNSGSIFFEVVDDEELQQMIEDENRKIATGEVEVATRRIRKDAGTTSKRQRNSGSDESGSDSDDPPVKKARKSTGKSSKFRSASIIVDSD